MTTTTVQIGVLAETLPGETRVAVTPEIIKRLSAKGLGFQVESGAGAAAHFPDSSYQEAGAQLVTREQVMQCDILLKVRKPSLEEAGAIRPGAHLFSFAESCEQDEVISTLLERGVNFYALERVPRISRAQPMDALSSQSNIAGYRAVIEAAAHYGRFLPLMMTSAGSAKPARVVILGAGVAGLQAIATARRLGADVHAYDVRPETAEQIRSLGAKVIELDLGESGSGEGGYAKELSDEAKQRQQEMLADELAKAHVIVTTALIPCRPAPVLVPESVVERMREGSVIADLAAATGGNCPLTEADQVVVKHGVTLLGHTNYPAMVPSDASSFLGKNLTSLALLLLEPVEGGMRFVEGEADEIITACRVMPDSASN